MKKAEVEEMEVVEEEDEYEKQLKFVNKMAQPMASKKLTKRLLKLVKKGRVLKIVIFKSPDFIKLEPI